MSFAWIDLKKAFDSVNHLKMIDVLNESGIPRKITRIIANMYRGNTLYMKTGETIQIQRSVLQGDPLSPTLLNLVLNAALKKFKGEIAYGNSKLNYLAFADVIMANTVQELFGGKLNVLYKRLSTFGLEINPSKCVHVKVNRIVKTHYVAMDPQIKVNNEIVPNLSSEETYKYLGIEISPDGSRLWKMNWKIQLERIGKSHLKTHQKLEALRQHLIPKMLYSILIFVFGFSTSDNEQNF